MGRRYRRGSKEGRLACRSSFLFGSGGRLQIRRSEGSRNSVCKSQSFILKVGEMEIVHQDQLNNYCDDRRCSSAAGGSRYDIQNKKDDPDKALDNIHDQES